MVIRHDDSNEDDEDFDDFSDIEPELVQLNHRGRGLSDTGKHYNSVLEMYHQYVPTQFYLFFHIS